MGGEVVGKLAAQPLASSNSAISASSSSGKGGLCLALDLVVCIAQLLFFGSVGFGLFARLALCSCGGSVEHAHRPGVVALGIGKPHGLHR